MKLFLLACVAVCWFGLSRSQAPDTGLTDIAKKCIVQEKVDTDYVVGFKTGKIRPEDVSQLFKCFVRCVVEAKGYMKDGKILEANVVKASESITTVEQVRKIIAKCNIVKGADVCETSYKIYMCISSELK